MPTVPSTACSKLACYDGERGASYAVAGRVPATGCSPACSTCLTLPLRALGAEREPNRHVPSVVV